MWPILREKCGAGIPPPYESPAWLVQHVLRWLKQSLTRGEPNRREAWLGQRAVGVETVQSSMYAQSIALAAGVWAAEWHASTPTPPIFPVKGQMMALQALPGLHLRHTVYASGVGGIVPKADGTISVGATVEPVGFDKAVTADGICTLLTALAKLTPALSKARVIPIWAGLRPASADGLPLIGPSRSGPGLWIAGGHFRDGILLGPLTGHLVAELMQSHAAPFGLDHNVIDSDRFDGWKPTALE